MTVARAPASSGSRAFASDLAEELEVEVRIVERRLDDLREVRLLVLVVDLGGDAQAQPGPAGQLDRFLDALLGGDPADERRGSRRVVR